MPAYLDQDNIVYAIGVELSYQEKAIVLTVVNSEQDGKLWHLKVSRSDDFFELDESLEGSKVLWSKPQKGRAEILATFPEREMVTLRFSTSQPPDKDQKITIYPPCFLIPLKEAWQDRSWYSEICLKYEEVSSTPQSINADIFARIIKKERLSWMRRHQKMAFSLFTYNIGYLWGPPGTGKTTTIGSMLAEYILKYPHSRVLLLSTTNVALDEALVSVDKALEQASGCESKATIVRERIKRIGNYFRPKYYSDRGHLLPSTDEEVLARFIHELP